MDGWELEWLGQEERTSATGRGGRDIKASGGEFDYGLDLVTIQPLEPLHDVVNVGTRFQVFEDDGDGHARTPEHPGATHLSRDAFDCRALRPIQRGHEAISPIHHATPVRGKPKGENKRPIPQVPRQRQMGRGAPRTPIDRGWETQNAGFYESFLAAAGLYPRRPAVV